MWIAKGDTIQMAVGDFGISLPFEVKGTTLTTLDCIRFSFKDVPNGETILTKDFINLQENKGILELTESESALFQVGTYCYSADWYQNGSFMCNIIPEGIFNVIKKV